MNAIYKPTKVYNFLGLPASLIPDKHRYNTRDGERELASSHSLDYQQKNGICFFLNLNFKYQKSWWLAMNYKIVSDTSYSVFMEKIGNFFAFFISSRYFGSLPKTEKKIK